VSGAPIPDDFGRAWRLALFAADAPGEMTRLAWVLSDLAFTQRSTVVTAGVRLLREETDLYGRSLERARDWLIERGFVVYDPKPGGKSGSRSTYGLLLPDETEKASAQASAPTRTVPEEEASAQASAQASAEASAQTRGRSDPIRSVAAEDFDFDRLIRPLERVGSPLTGLGRSEVASAFAECPEGVRSLVEQFERRSSLDNPLGALVAAVRRSEHRQASEVQARSRERRAPCPECGTGSGLHAADCSLAPVAKDVA